MAIGKGEHGRRQTIDTKLRVKIHGGVDANRLGPKRHAGYQHQVAADIPERTTSAHGLVSDVGGIPVVIRKDPHNTSDLAGLGQL